MQPDIHERFEVGIAAGDSWVESAAVALLIQASLPGIRRLNPYLAEPLTAAYNAMQRHTASPLIPLDPVRASPDYMNA